MLRIRFWLSLIARFWQGIQDADGLLLLITCPVHYQSAHTRTSTFYNFVMYMLLHSILCHLVCNTLLCMEYIPWNGLFSSIYPQVQGQHRSFVGGWLQMYADDDSYAIWHHSHNTIFHSFHPRTQHLKNTPELRLNTSKKHRTLLPSDLCWSISGTIYVGPQTSKAANWKQRNLF
jgi:hypothetical protein